MEQKSDKEGVVIQGFFLGVAVFLTVIFVLVGEKFISNDVSNLGLGVMILVFCLVLAPLFYMYFVKSVSFLGARLEVNFKNYFLTMAIFAGSLLALYAIAYVIVGISLLKI